jgi:hypothetical protein
MTPPTVEKRALLDRISELRAAGLTPKQIARTERLRPAEVAPLIRAAAGRQAAAAGPAALEGCWISPGWSTGLTIAGDPKWPDDRDLKSFRVDPSSWSLGKRCCP